MISYAKKHKNFPHSCSECGNDITKDNTIIVNAYLYVECDHETYNLDCFLACSNCNNINSPGHEQFFKKLSVQLDVLIVHLWKACLQHKIKYYNSTIIEIVDKSHLKNTIPKLVPYILKYPKSTRYELILSLKLARKYFGLILNDLFKLVISYL